MARKSLGTLTLDLVAKVGGFVQGMDKAERASEKWKRKVRSDLKRAGKAFATFSAGAITAMGALVVRNTQIQQDAVRQLEQGVKSTNGAVGRSVDELKRYASELQKVTIFGDEQIIQAQSQLVTFTNIAGSEFERVTEIAADLSTRFGTDLKSSILQLGKALNDPVANLSALSRSGIQFSKEQKELIKDLTESGRLMEAQNIILKELETQFGGSARAARDTLGGALKSLGNAFGDLFEVSEEGTSELTASIEDLISLLEDPQTVEAFQAAAKGFITIIHESGEALAGFINDVKSGAEDLASFFGGPADDDIPRLIDSLDDLEDRFKAISGGHDSFSLYGAFYNEEDAAKAKKEFEDATKTIANFEQGLDRFGNKLDRGQVEKGLESLSEKLNLLESQNFLGFNDNAVAKWQKRVNAYEKALESLNKNSPVPTVFGVQVDDKLIDSGIKGARDKASKSAPTIDLFGDGGDFGKDISKAIEDQIKLQEKAEKEAAKLSQQISDQVKGWQEQAEWIGKSSEEIAILKLEQLGATESQIESVKAAQERIDLHNKDIEATRAYKSLVEDLRTDEEKITDELYQRLEIIKEASGIADADRNKAIGRAIDGAFGEFDVGRLGNQEQIDTERAELEDWYSEKLSMLEKFRKKEADLNEEWDAKEAELRAEYRERQREIEEANEELRQERIMEGYQSILDVVGKYYEGMEGKEAAYARAAIQIGKTLLDEKKQNQLQELWANTHSAAMGAYDAMASIPYIGPVLGAAAAGAVYVAGASAAAGLTGMAHDGIDSVPQDGTWLLQQGERVTTAETSAKLDNTLDRVLENVNSANHGRAGGGVTQNINVKGRPDRRTAQQIAQETARKQRMTEKRIGV